MEQTATGRKPSPQKRRRKSEEIGSTTAITGLKGGDEGAEGGGAASAKRMTQGQSALSRIVAASTSAEEMGKIGADHLKKPKRGRRSKDFTQDPELEKPEPMILKRGNRAGVFICQVAGCGQFFSRKEHLERHLLMHTGEKPFKCSLCPKAFSREDNLKHHQRLHQRKPSAAGEGEEGDGDVIPSLFETPPTPPQPLLLSSSRSLPQFQPVAVAGMAAPQPLHLSHPLQRQSALPSPLQLEPQILPVQLFSSPVTITTSPAATAAALGLTELADMVMETSFPPPPPQNLQLDPSPAIVEQQPSAANEELTAGEEEMLQNAEMVGAIDSKSPKRQQEEREEAAEVEEEKRRLEDLTIQSASASTESAADIHGVQPHVE